MAHGLLVGVRVTIDEIDCPHDHAGCTETALQPMMLAERFLHRMQFFFRPDAFFVDLFETALEPGEILVRIEFPRPSRSAYIKFRNPASRDALVGVFVAEVAGRVRVAVTGAGPKVFRELMFEEALQRKFSPEAVKDLEVSASGLSSDLHASAEYRANLISVLARTSLRRSARTRTATLCSACSRRSG